MANRAVSDVDQSLLGTKTNADSDGNKLVLLEIKRMQEDSSVIIFDR